MNQLDSSIQCPYCWETLHIIVDPSCDEQEYVEDCQVCCQPIVVSVKLIDQCIVSLDAWQENA